MKQFTLSSNRSVITFSIEKIKVLVLSSENVRYSLNQIIDAICVSHKPSAYSDEHGDINAQLFIDEDRFDRARFDIERICLDASFEEDLKIKKGSLGYRILSNQVMAQDNAELMMELNGFLSLLQLSSSFGELPLQINFGPLNLGILSKLANIDSQLDGFSADYFDYDFIERLRYVIKCLNEGIESDKTGIFIFECFELSQNTYEILKTLNGYVLAICRSASNSFPIEDYFFANELELIDFANDILVRRKIMESKNCTDVADLLKYFLNK